MIRRIHLAPIVASIVVAVLAGLRPRPARADFVEDKLPEIFKMEAKRLLPKAVKSRLSFYNRTKKIFKTYADCVDAGGTQDECAAWAVLCDLQAQDHRAWMERSFGAFGRYGPFIADQVGLFDAFQTHVCGDDCFWCCLTPTGCHSSFGPSPVINCNVGYGEGTHTLGHTLITDNPTGTNACLAIPQTCDLYSECRIAGNGGYTDGLPEPDSPYEPPPVPDYEQCTPRPSPIPPITTCNLDPSWVPAGGNRVLEPHPDTTDELMDAIAERKIRYIVESLARKVQDTIDNLPADRPIDELADLVTMRGCVGHRRQLDDGEPFDGTHAFLGPASGGENPQVTEMIGDRRGMFFIAMFRILGGVPNLYERLKYVESRVWTCQDRVDYLRTAHIEDPDGELLKTMSPFALGILKQVEGLQDYRLLAVPMPDETPPPARWYNGCELGAPPVVALDYTNEGNEVVLRVSATDPEGVPGVDSLPVTIEWGDGVADGGELPLATLQGTFRHTYRAPGKYAVVAAVAGQSGLRGLAGYVLEATGGDAAAPRPIGFSRVALPAVKIFADGIPGGNFDVGTIGGAMSLVEEDGLTPLGRVPEEPIALKKVETVDGMEMVTDPGLTDFGDLVGYNPDRVLGDHIALTFHRQGGTFWDGRNIHVLLHDVTVDVQSPQRGMVITKTVPLTADLVKVYYADQPMTAEPSVTIDPDGTVRVPLASARGAGHVPFLDRIEIDLSSIIAAAELGTDDLSETPVGVRRRWHEETPCDLVAEDVEGFPDAGVDAGVDATGSAGDGGGGGCAGCAQSEPRGGGVA
ncbi:MAG TPA: hypothetical protein VHE35_12800, partial [Kofleriaceae bacterium]|nr:hypothetical protein [Kofleriaceae bacterium]